MNERIPQPPLKGVWRPHHDVTITNYINSHPDDSAISCAIALTIKMERYFTYEEVLNRVVYWKGRYTY